MLKKYGRVILLFALLFILMEATFVVNRLIDGNLDQQKSDATLKKLKETVESSDAKEKGLNEYQVIWDYELKLLRDEYPKDNAIIFEYVEKTTWNDELSTLIEEISNTYFSDNDILERLKGIIPDQFEDDVFEDYLLSIVILNPNLYTDTEKNT